MADTTDLTDVATPAPSGSTLPPPEERGGLEVRDKVVRHVSRALALEVSHTLEREGRLGRLTGAASPAVDVTLRGDRASVGVRVEVVWPCPVATVAAEVRRTVIERAPELSGVGIGTVDVVVAPVLPRTEARRVE